MKKNIMYGLLVTMMVFCFITCDNPSDSTEEKRVISNPDDGEASEAAEVYTVIFNLDGGNIDENESAVVISVKKNETINNNLPVPKKNAYDFSGWFTEKNGKGTNFTSKTVVKSNVSVYAKWTLIDYVSVPKQLSDTRFNGIFTGTRVYSSINTYYDLKLTLDGTNKIKSYSKRTANGISEDSHEFTYEMELNGNGQFRRRLWSNPFDNWTEWLDYEFGPGDKLTIQWYSFFKQGAYDVYFKTDVDTVESKKTTAERAVVSNSNFSDEETFIMMKQIEALNKSHDPRASD